MAVITHLGVNPEREVHRRGSLAQANHIALGSEHEDLFVEEIFLDRRQIVVVIIGAPLLLPVDQLPQPVEPFGIPASRR